MAQVANITAPPKTDRLGPFAHTVTGQPSSAWQPLDEHLCAVGSCTQRICAFFEAGDLGEIAGRWHDLGKYAPDFDAYLQQDNDASNERRGRVDHSSAGAILAWQKAQNPMASTAYRLAAFAIAGHHSGLANILDLQDRVARKQDRLDAALAASIPDTILSTSVATIPPWASQRPETAEFLGRMVFSALVDADRLDTEAFCSPASAAGRKLRRPSLSSLRKRLEAEIDRLARRAPPTTINAVRAQVRHDCLVAAARRPGIFSLTVPTGGGKTLAALTFGLEHALAHGLERVIVAIPYTSIIEQTASVYRKLFGADAVVEHHSAIEPQHDTDANRRACENWDAPIIVTTNVQLLETLFTHRPSRARKLHAVCRSVIILDEAQTLPPQFLTPILDGLQELVGHYGASIVISTATQPALASRLGTEVTEIVSDPSPLFGALNRVEIVLPARWDQPTSNAELAARLAGEEQFLLITHRRADAQELASLIPDAFHLSAAMCGAHRQGVMRSVRKRLSAGLRCRLVSTQVVEAGVDLDFPLVLRAFGPLDALAQAAGRCNREGRLQDATGAPRRGRFEVYCATSAPPPAQRSATDVAKTVLRLRGGLSLADPTLFTEYFDRLYSNRNLDAKDIQRHRAAFQYETVGNTFELIPDQTVPIIVPYPGATAAARHLEHALASGYGERQALRQIQRYIVAVPRSDHAKLFEANDLDRIGELVDVLRSDAQYARYDRNLGLVLLPQLVGAGASTTANGDLP